MKRSRATPKKHGVKSRPKYKSKNDANIYMGERKHPVKSDAQEPVDKHMRDVSTHREGFKFFGYNNPSLENPYLGVPRGVKARTTTPQEEAFYREKAMASMIVTTTPSRRA